MPGKHKGGVGGTQNPKNDAGDGLGFDRIVYFGDSLTDSDEFFAASSAVAFVGIPLTALGYAGQFSNGPVYADLVPGLIGVEGGEDLNYAVGGAQVLTDRTIAELLPPSIIRPDATPEDIAFRIDVDGQIDRFLADAAGQDLSSTAVSIFIGFNDFNDFAPMSAETALTDAIAYGALLASETLEDAAALAAAGAGTVILNTLGDPSIFPGTQNDPPALQALGTAASASFNQTLEAGAGQIGALGAEVVIVDFAAIFAEIEGDFTSFGFRTLDDPVILPDADGDGIGEFNPAVAGIPLDQVAFFDSVHPTAAMHGILAAFQAESLTSDVLVGGDGRDVLRGGKGDDLALGGEGRDLIQLRWGDDVGLGGLGRDLIHGNKGDDLVAGGGGRDRVHGGKGDDIIVDGDGNDRSWGGKGADLLIDGAGNDKLRGGRDDDVFVFTEGALMGREEDDRNLIVGGGGHDTLILRVVDADAVEMTEQGRSTVFEALGLKVRGVEEIVVVEGTDLSGEDFYSDQMAVADLWNFL